MGGDEGVEGVKPEWRARIAAWAAGSAADDRARLQAVWIFGSRARGTGRADSDLDIGIRMVGERPGEAIADWMAVKSDWTEAIVALIPDVQVEVHGTGPDLGDVRVWPSIEREGLLIYEANPGSAYASNPLRDGEI